MEIKLYNTLTRKKETFIPIRLGHVSLYSCGPTVYNHAHIGNLRAFVTADILVRTLRYNKYRVAWAMNTTDVDDKTIKGASALSDYLKDPKKALKQFTKKFEDLFWEDLEVLKIQKPDYITRATEYISAMEDLINRIRIVGFAYEKDGSVYFDVKKYASTKKYGQLIDLDVLHLRAGMRVDLDEYTKENAQDFALWKKAGKGEPTWTLPFGEQKLPGRPGWHIECSAMSHKVLPYPFDIHTGGVDLRFPHHENEIAQSTAGYGKIPAHIWVHNDHLLVDGKKMAKSEGNFITLQTLIEKGFSPLAYRYFLLAADYKKTVNFTWEALEGAETSLHKLRSAYKTLTAQQSLWTKVFSHGKEDREYVKKFEGYINDDLDTPRALALLWEVVKNAEFSNSVKTATMRNFDTVLGFGITTNINEKIKNIPQNILDLTEMREGYRKEKNWQKSDQIRAEIESLGFEIRDTETGPKITKK